MLTIVNAGTLIKIVRQNRVPFLVLTLSFAFFLAAIIYGGRLIYVVEANTMRSGVADSMNRDAATVKEFFSSCVRDLRFIKNVPGLRECLVSGNASLEQKRRAQDMLLMHVKSDPRYIRIRLIDSKGMEAMSLYNGFGKEPYPVLGSLLRDRRINAYFIRSASLGKDGIYASFFDEDKEVAGAPSGDSEPVIILVSPIFDKAGSRIGLLVLDISVRELLSQLSGGVFFQDGQGLLIISQKDGRLLKQPSPYSFTDDGGTIRLSDTDSVSYAQVEYIPGSRVWMARQSSDSPFKESMLKLEVVSVSILAIFFFTVLVLIFLNLRHFRNDNMAQKAIIHSLANLSEWRDPETGSHLERTRNFSVLLARTLHKNPKFRKVVTDEFLEALYDAVPLHDIGKVAIRDDILLKSSRLSLEEFSIMKNHVAIGRDIIQDIIGRFRINSRFLQMSRNICHYHHEKYDGSGYPESLIGDDIPIEARIFAICDVYDALRAKRPYKPGLTHEEAVETILPDRGGHFDPAIVDAFVECGDRFNEIFEAYKLFDNTYGKLMNARCADAMKIEWPDDMSVGDAVIDSQHAEFINRANNLFSGVLLGEGKRETLREIEFLHDYALYHFSTEEALMERYGVPELDVHKSLHGAFLRNLTSIRVNVVHADDISSALVVEINAKVVNWVMAHIFNVDKKMGIYIKSLGEVGANNDR